MTQACMNRKDEDLRKFAKEHKLGDFYGNNMFAADKASFTGTFYQNTHSPRPN